MSEVLATMDSADLTEMRAYLELVQEWEQAPPDVESQLLQIFGPR